MVIKSYTQTIFHIYDLLTKYMTCLKEKYSILAVYFTFFS